MSEKQLERLAPDLKALLSRARPGVQVPQEAQDRLLALLGPLLVPAAPPALNADDGASAVQQRSRAGSASRAANWLITKKNGARLASAVVGIALGAAGHAGYQRISTNSKTAASVRSGPSVPMAALADRMTEVPPELSGTRRVTEPQAEMDRDNRLNEERTLLDAARTELHRGNPGAALAELQTHKQRFPNGQLVKEREGLIVQSLSESGRVGQARERSVRFQKSYSDNMRVPSVEPATGSSTQAVEPATGSSAQAVEPATGSSSQ